MVDGEYKEYTEWCTKEDTISAWDDAVLVLETEMFPEIKVGKTTKYEDFTNELFRLCMRSSCI